MRGFWIDVRFLEARSAFVKLFVLVVLSGLGIRVFSWRRWTEVEIYNEGYVVGLHSSCRRRFEIHLGGYVWKFISSENYSLVNLHWNKSENYSLVNLDWKSV